MVLQVRKIHFTAVFGYAEAAETELRRKLGITDDWPDYLRRRVEADYLAVLLFDDVIDVRHRAERVGTTSITSAWEIDRTGERWSRAGVRSCTSARTGGRRRSRTRSGARSRPRKTGRAVSRVLHSLRGHACDQTGGEMEKARMRSRGLVALAALAVALLTAAGVPAASENAYTVTNLQSTATDSSLVNGWGLAALTGSPWWVADNGTNVSTLYNAAGVKQALTVQVHNAPTGLVANDAGTGFVVTKQTPTGPVSGSSRFIFSTEEGTILGWSPTVDATNALVAVPNTTGAIYKGLAIAPNRLYATDFHNAVVDVFDSSFQPVTSPGAFSDPKLPAGYAPFGIQNVNGAIVVTYAKQDADAEDEVAGQGLGFVDAYDTSGNLIGRIAQHGQLNAPWGIVMAPPTGFGAFSGDLLIGNFGDGEISAYEPQPDGTWELVGQLRGSDNKVLSIDGLWALQFGRGALANNGPTTTLFFTAGPNDETTGLFGKIMAG
jgi:uncharacterized protein (TIGR03118 family)